MKTAFLLSVPLLLGACAPSSGPTLTATPPAAAAGGLAFLPKQAEKGELFKS